MHDVIVIGAGPAGSMTARRLADRGHDVLLLEEHEAVGRPVHCTGLLGTEAFDEFDLPRDVILGRAGTARFWGAAGQSVPVGAEGVRASIIDRALLDERLAQQAVDAGAVLRTRSRVDYLHIGARSVAVGVRGLDQPIAGRVAVLACGAIVSERKVRGTDAFWGAAAAGGLLGIAALLSYGAAWFAVSLLAIFFARRRSSQILVAAGAALAVLGVAAAMGNSWPYGLVDTYNAAIGEIAAHPGQLWWLALMPALVCVACGPAVIESLRRFGSSAAKAADARSARYLSNSAWFWPSSVQYCVTFGRFSL